MNSKDGNNRFGRRIVATLLLAACSMVPAALADTQPTYDRRIEEAAIRMLQPKLGDIRGTLDLNTDGHLFPPLSRRLDESLEAYAPAELLRGHSEGSFIHF
ncbi:hypothetical protein IMCC20628_02814 [Hoeflea sp. IMCC20628]|uniref:hypothetical protein n=1 Tax=Hoeflea sp. IMCC20628 TaxID=1620421 RepID=UPI00063AB8D8|nr:hypothetical protein [Hoeflea sp. IMCC20628]AKI01509.1 hypothetical protein IMCC20628_02814 [Hoeflea sp. IMCC20628]